MIKEFEHLSPETQVVAQQSKPNRIAWLQSRRWIGYTLASNVIKKLDELATHKPTDRMPNLLLYGGTNNGKTTIVRKFAERWGSKLNEETGIVEYPILYMQMPPSPEESRFYDNMLNILKAPYRQRDSISRKQSQAITIMRNLGVKLLIIDEFHHLLIGRINRQRLLVQSIKYLGNELCIPIVAVGTDDALRAIRVEPQVSNRFDQIELPRWKNNDNFRRLLMSFERLLPLPEQSHLEDPQIATKLHSMSEGTIGELSKIINLTCSKAIKKGSNKLTIEDFMELDWKQPSAR